jgi:sorting and assembly machinery component 37
VDDEEREQRKARELLPEALRSTNKNKQTVTGLVKKSQGGMRFRLDALVDALCEPLEHLLGQKGYFLYDHEPSSLDCLALGHLSLALVPDVPMKWLRERMESRWPALVEFARIEVKECFGGKVGLEDALLVKRVEGMEVEGQLPWRAPELKGAKFAEKVIWNEVLDWVPLHRSTIITSSSISESESDPAQRTPPSSSSALLPTIITATTALAAVAGYLLYAGFRGESENRRLSDMGEAGAILAGLDFGDPEPETRAEVPMMRGGVPVGLEVDVGVDEKG